MAVVLACDLKVDPEQEAVEVDLEDDHGDVLDEGDNEEDASDRAGYEHYMQDSLGLMFCG